MYKYYRKYLDICLILRPLAYIRYRMTLKSIKDKRKSTRKTKEVILVFF